MLVPERVACVQVSYLPDVGIVSSSLDSTLRVCDAITNRMIATINLHTQVSSLQHQHAAQCSSGDAMCGWRPVQYQPAPARPIKSV